VFCDVAEAEEVFPTPRDSVYSFTVAGGFRGVRVSTGSLPGTMRFNEGNRSLYVVDRSDLGLIQVSTTLLTVVTNYY
jgi:hypothetical protein